MSRRLPRRGADTYSPLEADEARDLLAPALASPRGRPKKSGKVFPISRGGRTLDKVGAIVKRSRPTLAKIRELHEAYAEDPARFGPLLAKLEATGKVHGPWAQLRRMRDEDRVRDLAPVVGRYRTLVLDPPWPESELSEEAEALGLPYATMTPAEIAAVPVTDWADDPSHLYLWARNNTLPLAFDLVETWGFAFKTLLTWRKPKFGRGRYFRNRTEHVLFAVQGDLRTRTAAQGIPTDFEAPVGAHSEKPEAFYALVRAASYPPFGEAFQREARADFANLYQPIGASPARLQAAE